MTSVVRPELPGGLLSGKKPLVRLAAGNEAMARDHFGSKLSEWKYGSSVGLLAESRSGKKQGLDSKDDPDATADVLEDRIAAVASDGKHGQSDHEGAKCQQSRDVGTQRHQEEHGRHGGEGLEQQGGGLSSLVDRDCLRERRQMGSQQQPETGER